MLAHRYNQDGPVADWWHQNLGKQQVRSREHQAVLAQLLDRPSPDGGQWSGHKVAHGIGRHIGRAVTPQQEYVCRWNRRPLVPRLSHEQAAPIPQEELKKLP